MSNKKTSFDKMLSDYQGTLPDISSTTFNIEDNAAQSVNKAIDESIRDHALWTERAVKLSQDLEKNKTDPWKELTSLVKPLSELHELHVAKENAKAQIESFEKRKYENKLAEYAIKTRSEEKQATAYVESVQSGDVEAKGEGGGIDATEYKFRKGDWSEEDKEWLIKNGYWDPEREDINEEANVDKINKYLIDKDKADFEAQVNQSLRLHEAATNAELSIDQQIQLILNSSKFNEAATAREIGNDMIVDAPYTINALLGVKKLFPGMDRPLSYLDATSENATPAEAAWAGELMKDAIADYMAANVNKIDKIGERYFREEVFPKIYEHSQMLHKKTLNETLANAKAQNEKKNLSLFSTSVQTQGIKALTGPTGILAVLETGVDGTKNNVYAWNKAYSMFEEALQENLLDHEDVAGILQQKFIARNTNKPTTLKELKPYFYERLFRLKERYKRRDGTEADTYKKDDIESGFNQIKENPEGYTKGDLVEYVRKKAIEHDLSPTDPLFNEIDRLIKGGDITDALTRLKETQKTPGQAYLLSDLEALPETGPGSGLRKYWLKEAQKRGIIGWTKEEMDVWIAKAKNSLSWKADLAGLPIDSTKDPKAYEASLRFEDFFKLSYETYLRTKSKIPGYKTDPVIIGEAIDFANSELEKAVQTYRTENEDPFLFGQIEVTKIDPRVIDQHEKFKSYLVSTGAEAKTATLYTNKAEEIAIIDGIKAIENGQVLPEYWRLNAPYYNMDGPSLFEIRAKSTAHLRDGVDDPDGKGESWEDKWVIKPYDHELSTKASHAKTAQYIVTEEHVNNMLDDLQRDDAEVNSFFRTTTKEQEAALKGIDNMSLEEILELRTRPNWNDDIGIGRYDLKFSAIAELLTEPGLIDYIGPDAIFNEETQKKLIYARMIQKGNQAGSTKSWDNQYRRLKWLTDEEIKNFNTIMQKIQGQETYKDDPFNSLNLLSDEVAKAALEDAMSYGYA